MFIYFSCYFDIDQGYSSAKQVEKENKPRRKFTGLDDGIKDRFKKGIDCWGQVWNRAEKSYILVWNRVRFLEPYGTRAPKIWGSTPRKKHVDSGAWAVVGRGWWTNLDNGSSVEFETDSSELWFECFVYWMRVCKLNVGDLHVVLICHVTIRRYSKRTKVTLFLVRVTWSRRTTCAKDHRLFYLNYPQINEVMKLNHRRRGGGGGGETMRKSWKIQRL